MKKRGFTIIELLIVIAIIGLLSTMVIFSVNEARKKAKISKAQGDIGQINKAIRMLAHDTSQWPGHNDLDVITPDLFCGDDDGCTDRSLKDEVAGITSNDTSPPYEGYRGPYMEFIPNDPWGHEYFFDLEYKIDSNDNPCEGSSCDDAAVVGSMGSDGNLSLDDIIFIIYK